MRDKLIHERRNKMIYQYYCTRWGDGYRDEVIFADLSNQFHLKVKTLEDIVRAMRKKSQLVEDELNAKQLELPLGGDDELKEI
jgi:hypothetical protein